MMKHLAVLAAMSLLLRAGGCEESMPDAQDIREVRCTLVFQPAGNPNATLSLAHQQLAAGFERPAPLRDLPGPLRGEPRYYLARLGGRDVPMVLDFNGDMGGALLYVDTDGDGSLSDETGYAAELTARRTNDARPLHRFGPIAVGPGAAGGAPKAQLEIVARGVQSLDLYPAGYYLGEIRLRLGTYKVALADGDYDGRYDGTFSAPVANYYRPGCDLLSVGWAGPEHFEFAPLGRLLRIEEGPWTYYYSVAVAADGSSVELKKVEPDFGTLDLGGVHVLLCLWSDAGKHLLSGRKESWQLPAGHYAASPMELRLVDEPGQRWTFRTALRWTTKGVEAALGELRNFEIAAGQVTALKIGPPFTIRTSVERKGAEALIGFDLQGRAGELYVPGALRGGDRIAAPKLRILDEAGRVVGSGQFEYG